MARSLPVSGRAYSVSGRAYSMSLSNYIDSFERGDLTPYTQAHGTESFGVDTTSPVIEGSYSCKNTTCSDYNMYISMPGDGLNSYPKDGDTISGYLYIDTSSGDVQPMYGWYMGDTANGGDGYAIMTENGLDEIQIRRYDNGSSTLLNDTAVTLSDGTWYDVEVAISGSTFTGRIYDVDQTTGDRLSQLASVSTTDSTYTPSGGYDGFSFGNRANGGGTAAIDGVRKVA